MVLISGYYIVNVVSDGEIRQIISLILNTQNSFTVKLTY